MAIGAFVSGAVSIFSTAQGLLGGGKDAERAAANVAAYNAAIAGDDNALAFLRQRTGNYGIANIPGYGGIGGWGSSEAKADAQAKYNAAVNYRQIADTAQQAGGVLNEQLNKAGVTLVPGTKQEIQTGMVVLVVAAVAVAWLVLRKG